MDQPFDRRPSNSSMSSQGIPGTLPSSAGPVSARPAQSRYFNNNWNNNVTPWIEQQQSQDQYGKSSPSPIIPNIQPQPLHDTNDANDSQTNENDDEDENDDDDIANDSDDNDELIPTAIVIKNIPFAIKKEQLLDVMTKLNLPLPYAFNYHFDNGVFRGLAFANFTSTDETTTVVNQLNGREIGGRKLRVEYKKMLPLAERERIEREKREKRGQLEEQHRSTSNASLASMISVASAPAGGVPKLNQVPIPTSNTGERFYAPIPAFSSLPIPPKSIDLNDAETLEYYNQLIFFRDDKDRFYNEIVYPQTLPPNHKKTLSILINFLGLIEVFENNLILVKRKSSPQNSIIVPNNEGPPNLLRSHSQSSIPLLNNRFRNQPPQAIPPPQQAQTQQAQQAPQQPRIPPNFQLGLTNLNNSLSSAALLRNNPTPTRGNLFYSQNFYAGHSQQGLPTSTPSTPGLDPMTRFNLQVNQAPPPPPGLNWDEGNSVESDLNDSLNGLNLSLDSNQQQNIWGQK